jgi:uncharacterized membrane protein
MYVIRYMLGTTQLRLLFACIYIVVDVVYIMISSDFYNRAVQSIQGEPIASPIPIGAALGAYIAMGLGWYFLAAGTALQWYKNTSLEKWQAGLLAGLLYGFALYGTYNFTNMVMFKNYDYNIVLRDTSWGTIWGGISVMLFMMLHE